MPPKNIFQYKGTISHIGPNRWKGKTMGMVITVKETEDAYPYVAFVVDNEKLSEGLKEGDYVAVDFTIIGFSYNEIYTGHPVYKNNVIMINIVKL